MNRTLPDPKQPDLFSQYVAPLSPRTQKRLGTFFETLQRSPDDLSRFRITDSILSEGTMQRIQEVDPLEELGAAEMEQIRSLERHGVSFDVLGSQNPSEDKLATSNTHALLDTSANLITSLFTKQKNRLDHEPVLDEHYIAHSLVQTLATACSNVPPHGLASQESIIKARKVLQKQVSCPPQ